MANIIATWKDVISMYLVANDANQESIYDAALKSAICYCTEQFSDSFLDSVLSKCPTYQEINSGVFDFMYNENTYSVDLGYDLATGYGAEQSNYSFNDDTTLYVSGSYANNQLVCAKDIYGKRYVGWEYTYLQTNGSAYIPLGVSLHSGDIVVVSYYISQWGTTNGGSPQSPCGTNTTCNFMTYWDASSTIRVEQRNGAIRKYNQPSYSIYKSGVYLKQRTVIANTVASNLSYSINTTTPYTLTGTDPGKLNVSSWSYTGTMSSASYSGQLTAFATTNTGSWKMLSGGRIYGIEVYRSGSLYRQYIPFSGGKFYETITNTFYAKSAGTVTASGTSSAYYQNVYNLINLI